MNDANDLYSDMLGQTVHLYMRAVGAGPHVAVAPWAAALTGPNPNDSCERGVMVLMVTVP